LNYSFQAAATHINALILGPPFTLTNLISFLISSLTTLTSFFFSLANIGSKGGLSSDYLESQ